MTGERSTRRIPAGSSVVREAKLFMNGRSQAVRLPAEFRFEGDTVLARKWRGAVILLPRENPWEPLLASLGTFSSDFMEERDQAGEQRRAELDSLFDAEE
ncbi:MAG TPA: type II toxin-antitoxin system VapB family antitoxin [Longimicrobiales bacterium]|nr:type II toxin-antitoxin system VapB family antitoxin [Longimicrobiales bacterium]